MAFPVKEEPFISDISNYQQTLDFDLYAIRYPSQTERRIIKNWNDEVALLLADEDFGQGINNSGGFMNDAIKSVLKNETNPIEKTKLLYYYVRDNFKCTNKRGKYLTQTLKQVFQKKEGSIADLNLLLTAIYVKAGLISKPVILSTRDNGIASETFPSADKYNYLICLVRVGNEKILVDASNKFLPFGMLKPECYNGNAKVIDTSYLPIMLSTDSLKENCQTTSFIFNGEKSMEGSFTKTFGNAESFFMRQKLSTDVNDNFFKEIKKKYNLPVEITNMSLDSLKKTEYPVSVHYDTRFNLGDESIIYFSPMLSETINYNPFKAGDRSYPVEMPYCINEVYILNMEIPKGYIVDELPKSARVKLNGDDGVFEYIIGKTETTVQLKCTLKLNKANFLPNDYQTLRDFYSFVVKKEAEQIVFKKTN